MLVRSLKVGDEISFGEARLTVLRITRGPHVRLGIMAPHEWLVYPEEAFDAMSRSATAHESTGHNPRRTRSVAVAEILSRASYLKSAEDFEELTSGLLALRAKRLAPVVSGEETRLLLSINEGVSDELTDRVASLIEKRDDGRLTLEEHSELQQLADEVERRGVERLEALSKLAALRGVSLRELMLSFGVATGDHG
jgi:sRNA-binding carbon storage regulator CsrA